LDNLAHEVNDVPWHVMYSMNDYNKHAEFFYYSLNSAIEETVPTYSVKMSSSDRPWITPYFKSLIRLTKRGNAFANGNLALYPS